MRKRKEVMDAEVKSADPMFGGAADGSSQTIDIIDDSAELVDGSPVRVVPPRVELPIPTPEQIAAMAPKRFRVVTGGRIIHRGYMTVMRPGKEITDGQYDLDRLRSSGIILEPIE